MSRRISSTRKLANVFAVGFRAKIIIGFAAVLAISAVSMAFAYLGFERVSADVASHRASVSEADLGRNVDRELLAYPAAARYFVVSGKEADAKTALDAEATLKDAIEQAIKGSMESTRLEDFNKLDKEFSNCSATFSKILQLKRDTALVLQDQLLRNAERFTSRLDDIARKASATEAQTGRELKAEFQKVSAMAMVLVSRLRPRRCQKCTDVAEIRRDVACRHGQCV